MEETRDYADFDNKEGSITAQPVAWTASEYISHEKSMSWHGILYITAVVLSFIVYLVSKDKLAVLVILMSAVAMSVYAKKKPSLKSYELSSDGIGIDNQFYSYDEFRSFSILEEGAVNSIWLKRLQRFSPPVVIYFSKDEEERIQDILENYLPFEEKNLDFIDRATKRIRF